MIALKFLLFLVRQPPSGGCVLKRFPEQFQILMSEPAAFGRLCVETALGIRGLTGRQPAAFGRLCVETTSWRLAKWLRYSSRLRAAVC